MNIVDLFSTLLLISTIIRGAQLGFVRQMFSTAGFFIGLLVGLWLERATVSLAHTALSRAILALVLTLGLALLAMAAGEYLGVRIKSKLVGRHLNINTADSFLGSVVGVVTLLLTIWLTAAVLLTLPFPSLQDDLRSSFFVSNLNQKLPAAPNVVADLGHLIDPNGFPQVFNGQEPQPGTATLPNIGQLQSAVNADKASVLKIEGRGCGGIVEGSGFVIGSGLVATNAHVVAGVDHPFVIDGTTEHAAQVIWFDPNLDFAVLRVDHLSRAALTINTTTAPKNTPTAVLGYPGGGNFSAQPAVVIDAFVAGGRNIYNQGVTDRDIYEIKATVIPGNSGGPLVEADGSVVGVVFATSTTYNDVGYALTMDKVSSEITQAKASTQAVSSGSCAQ